MKDRSLTCVLKKMSFLPEEDPISAKPQEMLFVAGLLVRACGRINVKLMELTKPPRENWRFTKTHIQASYFLPVRQSNYTNKANLDYRRKDISKILGLPMTYQPRRFTYMILSSSGA